LIVSHQRARCQLDVTGTDRSAAEAVDELRIPRRRVELGWSKSAGGTH